MMIPTDEFWRLEGFQMFPVDVPVNQSIFLTGWLVNRLPSIQKDTVKDDLSLVLDNYFLCLGSENVLGWPGGKGSGPKLSQA